MRMNIQVACVLLLTIGILPIQCDDNSDSTQSIQIVTAIDNSIVLKLDELKAIFEHEHIKDREIVVVSMAGTLHQGKNFLLDFFVKYLNAQYKSHNVTDWMGESDFDTKIHRLKWRDEQHPDTIGISMWPEIFTHDFENGDKVAIVLLNTEIIFSKSGTSIRDCTSTFALSTMLSSVQCFNLMDNIHEDHLQYLDLFTQYGQLALNQMQLSADQKPFQYFLFIVRDWPYSNDVDYGWHGQEVIDDTFNENANRTVDMRVMRDRLQSSYQEIGAFLMPNPGYTVSLGKSFDGYLRQIDSVFRDYVQDLVASILAPENLVVKKIDGKIVLTQDFSDVLEAFSRIFNKHTQQDLDNVLLTTAGTRNELHFNSSLSFYMGIMQKLLHEVESYYSQNELNEHHSNAKNQSLFQFLLKSDLATELKEAVKRKIGSKIEDKFQEFKQKNEEKRNQFIEKVNSHHSNISKEILDTFILTVGEGLTHGFLSEETFKALFNGALNHALHQFDLRKISHSHLWKGFREKLEKEIRALESHFRHHNASHLPPVQRRRKKKFLGFIRF